MHKKLNFYIFSYLFLSYSGQLISAESYPTIKKEIKNDVFSNSINLNNKINKSQSKFTNFLQNELKDAVVQVFSQIAEFNWLEPYKSPSQAEVTGTAFFINLDGELITNAHVVDQAKAIFIQVPGSGKRRYEVDVIGVHPERDLALLKLKPNEKQQLLNDLKAKQLSCFEFGNCDLISKAEKVITIGFPLGQQGIKHTKGVVSGRETVNGQHFIQIDAALNKGNSGGPSIDKTGKVIGVNSAIYQGAQNVGYIIPVNDVVIFLDQLNTVSSLDNKPKLIHKPYLGVVFNNANDNLTKFLNNPLPGGLYVVEIYKNSPLDKAGLKAGDMIYKINDINVDIFGEMQAPWSKGEKISIIDYVARLKIGQLVNLEYYRKGQKLNTSFIFTQSERPPIRRAYPGYEKIDYEALGGLVIMQLTLNHVVLLAQIAPELISYADIKKHMEPALIITHVMLNSPAHRSRCIAPGSIIAEVNGEKVKTLEDYNKAALKSIDTGYFTIKTTENIFLVLTLEEILNSEKTLSETYLYPLSNTFNQIKASFSGK